ncbi:hypothetical protein TRVA0_018S01508 [Trichomonascus vanleenenianus]|uniref:hydroxyacyl-thioester dehydratase HTD2 n=1 Tax=Trichomonascus vanleenenianus TaxID=2268995 RepID=UPI003ECA1967
MFKLARSTAFKRFNATLATPGPWKHTDYLSPTQCEYLDSTLEDALPIKRHTRILGEELSPGYHFVYFNPAHRESSLSSDGYESYQAPSDAQYPNRMWLGGSVEYNLKTRLLMGNPSVCVENILEVTHQQKNSGERLVVGLERLMKNSGDYQPWAVREERKLMYFSGDSTAEDRHKTLNRVLRPPSNAIAQHSLIPTSTMLFRYSALTFNSHKIHLDREYAQNMESLPELVVHGPLMTTLMLRWISGKVIHQLAPGLSVAKMTYRNLLPMFVGQKLTLNCGELKDGIIPLWITNHRNSMVFTGSVKVGEKVPEE